MILATLFRRSRKVESGPWALAVCVTQHAAERAAERYGSQITAAEVAGDVLAALRELRTAKSAPRRVSGVPRRARGRDVSYAFTAEWERVYVIRVTRTRITVITALPAPSLQAVAAAAWRQRSVATSLEQAFWVALSGRTHGC